MDRLTLAFEASAAAHQSIAADSSLQQTVRAIAARVVQSLRAGGRVLFCGNGGSAADAQHLAAELSGRFYFDRPPLDAEALHVNSSYLTAVANDYGYDRVFERLLTAKGRRGDVLIGLSTSGNSPNVVRAFESARAMGIATVALVGAKGGRMADLADFAVRVPATLTTRIQELHTLVGHSICELVEQEMFTGTDCHPPLP